MEQALELHRAGRLDDAVEHYQKALAVDPNYVQALSNLGVALKVLGRLHEAIASYQKAIAIKPDLAEAHANLGLAQEGLGRMHEAVSCYRKAISLKPGYAVAYGLLGSALKALGQLDEAVASYQQAIVLKPDFSNTINNLGVAQLELGLLDDAIASFKKAAAINPNLFSANFNHLHTLLYVPDLSSDELFSTYRQLVSAHHPGPLTAPTIRATPLTHQPPGERLRIGYLSSDFYGHPLGDIVMPLLSNHDHDQFEIFCYADVVKPDHVTEKFIDHADHWRPINGLTDTEIAGQIRDDEIHIMVYLAGFFDNNRPMIAVHRPAPVQVAMHGGTTTALEEMDFWLTDSVLHPSSDNGHTTEQFTEKLFRLPAFYIYPTTEGAPPTVPLPAEDNGFITFASFNKPCKMNETVVDLWSKVLKAVPDSRLIVKSKNYFNSPIISQRLLSRFNANGITHDRISLLGATDSFHDHLAHYNQADIALDTFPFAGATTTFQALWMGVPVISLMTDHFIGRAGGSISTHAGLGELVADTPQDYIDKAASLAGDVARLKDLRATLRERVSESPLCDGPEYAATVEKAFLDMWKSKVAGG